jgi:ParB family chromosome partitioning protein
MPQEVGDLWGFIAGLDHASVMALFAHCASLTVNALKLPWEQNKRRAHATADKLATALALDMSQHWTPTVSSYLGRVTKAHILAAVGEALGDEVAERLLGKKKQDMAEDAEKQLAGSGWLPTLLRSERPAWQDAPQQAEVEPETVTEAPEAAKPEDLVADSAKPAMLEPEALEPAGPDAAEIAETDAAGFADPDEAPTLADVPDPDAPEPEEIAPDMADADDGAVFHEAAE